MPEDKTLYPAIREIIKEYINRMFYDLSFEKLRKQLSKDDEAVILCAAVEFICNRLREEQEKETNTH